MLKVLVIAAAVPCQALFLGPVRAVRPLWAQASHALSHILEAQPTRLSSSTLEELSNAAIPSSEAGRSVQAFVARPSAPPTQALPVLILIHEFFGLSESITRKATLLADHPFLTSLCVLRKLATKRSFAFDETEGRW